MPSLFGAEVTEGYMCIRQIKRLMRNSEPSRTKKTIKPNSRGVASNAYFTPDVGAQVCHLSPPSPSPLPVFFPPSLGKGRRGDLSCATVARIKIFELLSASQCDVHKKNAEMFSQPLVANKKNIRGNIVEVSSLGNILNSSAMSAPAPLVRH